MEEKLTRELFRLFLEPPVVLLFKIEFRQPNRMTDEAGNAALCV